MAWTVVEIEAECGLWPSVILGVMRLKILYQVDPGNIKSLDMIHIVPGNAAESTRNIFRNVKNFFLHNGATFS